MSRFHPHRDPQPMYVAAEAWSKACLLKDGSLLSPALSLWTTDLLNELDSAFVQNYDEGGGTFLEKLENQLAGASAASQKLMAEVLWILMLLQSNVSSERKRAIIQTVWSWSGESINDEAPILRDDVLTGIGSAGTAYNTHRWRELSFLLTAVRDFKRKSPQERHSLLSEPARFATWIRSIPDARKRQFQHICLHLLFPDQYERISSISDKARVVAAFAGGRTRDIRQWDHEKVDQALLQIRQRLEAEKGRQIDFYTDDLGERLRGGPRSWLLSWNPENWEWSSLSADRTSTSRGVPVILRWRTASTQPKEGDRAYLMRVGSPPRGIIATGTVVKQPFEAQHYDSRRAEEGATANYIEVAFASVRDAAVDAIVRQEELAEKYPTQEWSPQASGIAIESAIAHELHQLWQALPPVNAPVVVGSPTDGTTVSVQVARARNLILYGPPGTGKTHRLQTVVIPEYLDRGNSSGQERRFEFITFHQSYSYEDFVEGIRPVVAPGGGVTYEVRAGIFKRLCVQASRDPNRRYAMIIDEINRANLAKVFGELITLIEPDKRARYDSAGKLLSGLEATLPYSGERFGVPMNLDLVGTMNTADRSIAILDLALRRRFEFEELVPVPGLITGADSYGKIPDGEGDEIDLRALLSTINKRIVHLLHRDMAIGHAFFMRVKDFPSLRRLFAQELIPLLQEYFYQDWRRMRLVFAEDGVAPEHQLIRLDASTSAEIFPMRLDDSQVEGLHFLVTPEAEITPDAIRKIYEPPE